MKPISIQQMGDAGREEFDLRKGVISESANERRDFIYRTRRLPRGLLNFKPCIMLAFSSFFFACPIECVTLLACEL